MSLGSRLRRQAGDEAAAVAAQVLDGTRKRLLLTLLTVALVAAGYLAAALANERLSPNRPSAAVKGATQTMEIENHGGTSRSANANNDSGRSGAQSGDADNSAQTDVDISSQASGGTTSGHVTVNGDTKPLPSDGSVHEHIDNGNVSLSLTQITTSSGSSDASQHTHVHSHTSANIDTEDL